MTSKILHELTSDKSYQHLPLPVLEAIYPRELMCQVLEQTGRWEQRERLLGHVFMMYLLIAWTLLPMQALKHVCSQLTSFGRWLASCAFPRVPTASALCYRRRTLGVAPLRLLFVLACRPLCQPETPGAFLFGRRLLAVDSKLFDVAETPQTDWTFRGRTRDEQPRRSSPFPQLRVLSALEIGSHAHVGAVLAPGSHSELSLVRDLLGFLPARSVVLQDSGFRAAWWIQLLQQHGHDSITRLQTDEYACRGGRLPDGSYLVETWGSSDAPLQEPLTLRIIEYQLAAEVAEPLSQLQGSRVHSGRRAAVPTPVVYRLATTLLDMQQAPTREIAAS